jgi:hypothetical protein
MLTTQFGIFRLLAYCPENVKTNMYKKILPVVLYVSEIWFLTLKEEHRLKLFGSDRDEIIRGWRKWCDEELHNL